MLWAAGVSALCLLVCLPLCMHYRSKLQYGLAVCFKLLGTLCAASMVLIAACRLDQRCWILFGGMMLHAAADVLLEYSLPLGAGFFLGGHICYICFFTGLFPVSSVHLICALCLLAICAFFFYRMRSAIGKRMPLFAVYGGVLSIMSACALGGFTGQSLQGILIAAGGALFFISDAMIFRRTLVPCGKGTDWFVLITYYSAQLLFAVSCLLM